jgi:uncharacterized protein YutE (UPF0331/DUF86 family)
MYYINHGQIQERLEFVPVITGVFRELHLVCKQELVNGRMTENFAQERALHLAIEVITDVGSLLIDGFMMRDASSYEDIIEILHQERVIPVDEVEMYRQLVGMRRSLTQHYMSWDRGKIRSDLVLLATILERFPQHVKAFIQNEFKEWQDHGPQSTID